MLLSRALAQRLGVAPGASLLVLVPEVNAEGQVVPRAQRMRLAGIFNTGTEVDNTLALIGLDAATRLRGQPGVVLGTLAWLAMRVLWRVGVQLKWRSRLRERRNRPPREPPAP